MTPYEIKSQHEISRAWEACCPGVIIHGPVGCTALDHFNLVGILLSLGSHTAVQSVLQLGTYKSLIGHFPDFERLSFCISLYKAEGPVGTCCNSIHIFVVENVHTKYLALVTPYYKRPWKKSPVHFPS